MYSRHHIEQDKQDKQCSADYIRNHSVDVFAYDMHTFGVQAARSGDNINRAVEDDISDSIFPALFDGMSDFNLLKRYG